MSRTTTNLGLYVPDQGEHYGTHMDDNLDTLDTASAGGTFGSPDATLSGSISAGALTFTITGASPSAAFYNTALSVVVAIGFGPKCEVKRILSLSEHTFTVSTSSSAFPNYTPFRYAHTAGEPVWILRDGAIDPWLFGIPASDYVHNTYTSQFQNVQCMILTHARSGIPINWRGLTGYVDRPIGLPGINVEIRDAVIVSACSGSGATSADDWAIQGCDIFGDFTANAATNTFTWPDYSGGDFPPTGINGAIMFNDPDGNDANLPGGILSGKRYWVKTSNPGAKTFTISDNIGLTGTVDITSNGSGVFYAGFDSESKLQLPNFFAKFIAATTSHPNGMMISTQQPTRIELRLEAQGNVSAQRWIFHTSPYMQGGQLVDVNVSSQFATGWRTMWLQGTLFDFIGKCFHDAAGPIDGDGNPCPNGLIQGAASITFPSLWSEASGHFVIDGVTDIDFGNVHGAPGSGAAAAFIDVNYDNNSYVIRRFRAANPGRHYYKDTHTGLDLIASEGGAGGIGDLQHWAPGVIKYAAQDPYLTDRRPSGTQHGGYVARPEYNKILVQPDNGGIDIKFYAADCVAGWQWEFVRDPQYSGGTRTYRFVPDSPVVIYDLGGVSRTSITIAASDMDRYVVQVTGTNALSLLKG